jgi:hypothetical protein
MPRPAEGATATLARETGSAAELPLSVFAPGGRA